MLIKYNPQIKSPGYKHLNKVSGYNDKCFDSNNNQDKNTSLSTSVYNTDNSSYKKFKKTCHRIKQLKKRTGG